VPYIYAALDVLSPHAAYLLSPSPHMWDMFLIPPPLVGEVRRGRLIDDRAAQE
jgi:hypothetical protein